MHCVYDQPTLEARLSHWKSRLRLVDWDVKVRLARARDFENVDEALGQIAIFPAHKSARILICDPVDWEPNSQDNFQLELDHEYVLVHELLHIHFYKPDEQSEMHHDIDEQGVYLLAHSLVELERELQGEDYENTDGVDVCPGLLDVKDDADGDRGDRECDPVVPAPPDDAGPAPLDDFGGAGDRLPQGCGLKTAGGVSIAFIPAAESLRGGPPFRKFRV